MTVLNNLETDTDDTEMDDGIACVKMTPVRDDSGTWAFPRSWRNLIGDQVTSRSPGFPQTDDDVSTPGLRNWLCEGDRILQHYGD